MRRNRLLAFTIAPLLLLAGCGGGSGTSSFQFDQFTSFEFNEFPPFSTDFTLGTPPKSVRFTGGRTLTVGVPNLYRTGIAAWEISGVSTVATADFDTPATAFALYAANQGSGQGIIRVYDESDVLIATIPVVTDNMMDASALIVRTAGELGVAGIGKVTVTNTSIPGNLNKTWIDDFSASQP
ncbi:MAG: hypothetical protein IH944_13070 [Armatimonadetes bacterium]|nr:hypothetical protein [Armatimonadota bacterium]